MVPRAQYRHLEPLIREIGGVPGDYAELGVWEGHTFVPLALAAWAAGRVAHGVDSWAGMAAPTIRDYEPDGDCRFPAGSLATGPHVAEALARSLAPIEDAVRLWIGWVPAVLARVQLAAGLAATHVDLDHYAPSLAALRWAWARTNPGGVLICHDYEPGADRLATAACDEFAAEIDDPGRHLPDSGHLWWAKP